MHDASGCQSLQQWNWQQHQDNQRLRVPKVLRVASEHKHDFICPYIHPSTVRPRIHPSIHPSIHPVIHSSIQRFIDLHLQAFIHSSIFTHICPSIHRIGRQ